MLSRVRAKVGLAKRKKRLVKTVVSLSRCDFIDII